MNILDALPSIFINNQSKMTFVVFYSLIINLLVFFLDALLNTFRSNMIGINTKVTTTLAFIQVYMIYIPIIFLLSSGIYSNYYVFKHAKAFNLFQPSFLIFFIFFILSFIVKCFTFLINLKTNFDKHIITEKIIFPSKFLNKVPDSIQNRLKDILIFMGILLYIITFLNVKMKIGFLNNIEFFKIALFSITILFIIFVIFFNLSYRIKFAWLEKFERNIIIKDLDSEDIRRLFIQEFVGADTRDWLNDINTEINDVKQNYIKALEEFNKNYCEIDINDIDINNLDKIKDFMYIIETNQSYIKTLRDINEKYTNVINEGVNKINDFMGKGNFEHDEIKILELINLNLRDLASKSNENIITVEKCSTKQDEYLNLAEKKLQHYNKSNKIGN